MKFSTTTKMDPIEIADLDELARPVAAAIRDNIVSGIRNIPQRADGSRPFNDTGKLVAGVRLEKRSDGSYSIVAPPDRLQDPRVMERLFELVPQLADPLSAANVTAAVEKSLEQAVRKR